MTKLTVKKLFAIVVLVMLCLNVFAVFVPSQFQVKKVQASGENWLTGWTYRKQHNITGSVGAGTNYAIKIVVIRSTGSDSGDTVYVGTNCLSNFADIRFTDDDGDTLLNAWNQTQYNGYNVTCWVEILDSLNSQATIYIYYGNVGASAYWNGNTTFNDRFGEDPITGVFDDFSTWKGAGSTVVGKVGGDIVRDGDLYHMYPRNGSGVFYNHHYVSTDLKTWTWEAQTAPTAIRPYSVLKNITLDNSGVVPIQYAGLYWMAGMNGSRFDVWSSTSLNGTWTWRKNILQLGTGAEWDSYQMQLPFFFKEGDTYCIWYQAYNGSTPGRIGFATSNAPNGTWTKSSNNPRLYPTLGWEGDYTIDPIMRKIGGTYYLYYTGNAGANCYNSYATSNDLNGTWTKSEAYLSQASFSFPVLIQHHVTGKYYLEIDDLGGSATKRWLEGESPTQYFNATWTQTGALDTIDYQPSGGLMTIQRNGGVNRGIISVLELGINRTVEFRANISSPIGGGTFNASGMHGWDDSNSATSPYELFAQRNGYAQLYTLSTTSGYYNLSTTYFDAFHVFRIVRKATTLEFLVDGVSVRNESSPETGNLRVRLLSMSAKAKIVADWIFATKWVAGVAHGAWGTQETSGEEYPTLTIYEPENTTYTSGTIPVNMTASDGEIDTYLYNCWNISASAWIYSPNQTYTTPTTMTGYVNGSYRFHGWVNNTDGNWDTANVTFTVAIPSGPPEVIIEIYQSSVDDTRISISVTAYVRMRSRFSTNGSYCTTGTLYINATACSINGTGWATRSYSLAIVGQRIFVVTGVNVNGETDYDQQIANPSVVWDKARIYYEALDDLRVNINANIEFRVRGLLLYDNHPLGSGDTMTANFGALAWDAVNLWFEGTRTQGTVGSYVFQISSLSEATYAITAFEVNVTNPTGIWDRLTVTVSASDTTPLNNTDVTISWTIIRQYDSSSVSSFSYTLNRNGSSYKSGLTNGSYIQNYADLTYLYTTGAVTDNTYVLTVFQTNTVTVTWSANPPEEEPSDTYSQTIALMRTYFWATILILSLVPIAIGAIIVLGVTKGGGTLDSKVVVGFLAIVVPLILGIIVLMYFLMQILS